MAPREPQLTREELKELVRQAIREEFEHVGLVVEETDHVTEAREDFRWLRRMRVAVDKASGIVGKVVLTAIAGVVIAAILKGLSLQAPPGK